VPQPQVRRHQPEGIFQLFAFLNNADEPELNVPDPAVTEQRRQQQEKIEKLTSELASKFPARDESIRWEPLTPSAFATTQPSRLVLKPDDSLLAAGPTPDTDEYIIEADANLDGINAFRLEALTDPSLPRDGPGREGGKGRNKSGNFVLSQFKVEQVDVNADGEPVGNPVRIKIDRAEADYNQPEFDVSKAIDDFFMKGWAIGGIPNKNHEAKFFTPDKLSGKKRLIITLKQLYKDHTLGKFRLSVGRTPPPPTTAPTEKDRADFLAKSLDAWEESIKSKAAHWTILDPSRFTRRHDATITKLDDKSLLFTGDNFYREEYKLEFDTDAKNVTAIRLELLPYPNLPKGGPGRDPNGGCLLSELTPSRRSVKAPQPGRSSSHRPARMWRTIRSDARSTGKRTRTGRSPAIPPRAPRCSSSRTNSPASTAGRRSSSTCSRTSSARFRLAGCESA
jgi:hypothetical protein